MGNSHIKSPDRLDSLDRLDPESQEGQFLMSLASKMQKFNHTSEQYEKIKEFANKNPDMVRNNDTMALNWSIWTNAWWLHNNVHLSPDPQDLNNTVNLSPEDQIKAEKISEIQDLIIKRAPHDETAASLDKIWMLYFATGDKRFPEAIVDVANKTNHLQVQMAAAWSYKSIMGIVIPLKAY